MFKSWEGEDALAYARALEWSFEPFGFHIGLTGSTFAKKGYREIFTDLDLIVYPHCSNNDYDSSLLKLKSFMKEGLGLILVADRTKTSEIWARSGSTDTKHVEVWKTKD